MLDQMIYARIYIKRRNVQNSTQIIFAYKYERWNEKVMKTSMYEWETFGLLPLVGNARECE